MKHAVKFHFDIFGPIQVTREKDEYDKDRDVMTVVLTVRDGRSEGGKHSKLLISDAFRGDSLLFDLFSPEESEKLE